MDAKVDAVKLSTLRAESETGYREWELDIREEEDSLSFPDVFLTGCIMSSKGIFCERNTQRPLKW